MTLLTYSGANRYFLREMADQAQAETQLYKEILQGWLGRYRALPSIYAEYQEVKDSLKDPTFKNVTTVNVMLEGWNSASGASDIYLLNKDGVTIASSNWNDPINFVGQNYSFRPYYTQAMQGRLGRFFALGVISGKRGYYFSYPVWENTEILGVLVVKLTVDEIEQELRARENEIFVADDAGVVIMASHPDWRLTTLGQLNQKSVDRIELERQFDISNLLPIGISEVQKYPDPKFGSLVDAVPDRSDKKAKEFLQFRLPMGAESWNLHLLVSTEAANRQALLVALFIGSLLLVLILIAFMLLQRRDRLMQMLEFRERARRTLEVKVEERTSDLKRSNEELKLTQSELVQAGKMAALGQMSTALSHEFNQPLTAIRTYAENANAFMDRGMQDKAEGNLKRILTLTQRMAQLSKRLSNFARKPNDEVRSVQLSDALHEALELLQARIEQSSVILEVDVSEEIWILGGQVRLQHVLMNLIANAMDEIANQKEKWIKINAVARDGKIYLDVTDSGKGVAEDIQDKIFDPFFTTKDVGQGVGLGLSISYNIIRDFGGVMRVVNSPSGGACFIVEMQQTTAPEV